MYSDESDLAQSDDNFKKIFKYYKSNKPKPSLDKVLSVEDSTNDEIILESKPKLEEDFRTNLLGLHKQAFWKTYSFQDHPGLLLIRNPFIPAGQRYWIRQCLEVYPRKPNKMNIDSDINALDWWKECYRNGYCDRGLQKKLRWITLGYHHDWDTKIYSDENRNQFPVELLELTDVIATYLGYTDFNAEAAIVNYYHMDSTLSAHTDHSEVNLEAPLFSFSFGQSAIFLLGGRDKSIEPSAFLLNSGDIVIMSKEARLCYHAVPKILPAKSAPWNDAGKYNYQLKDCDIKHFKHLSLLNEEEIYFKMASVDKEEWVNFNSYIQESRINMNVRQVLNEKQKSLSDSDFIGTGLQHN